MKTYNLIIIFLALLSLLCHGQLGATKPTVVRPSDTSYNTLTDEDRLKYDLTISLDKIQKNYCDTSNEFYSINEFYRLDVQLNNNSNDTLKYIDWTCSSEIWKVDTKIMRVDAPYEIENCGACTANFIAEFDVPPHQVKKLYVFINKKDYTLKKIKFKIGMILQRVLHKKDFRFYQNYFFTEQHHLFKQARNIIWSNSIEIP